MTRTQSGAHWSGVPSLSQLLLAALLRLAAMLVSNAAYPLRMLLTLLPRECHTDVERDRLPARRSSNLEEEEHPAATHSQTTEALMVSRPRSGRPSNHEGGLTNPFKPHGLSWIPAFAGTSGEQLLAASRS